MAAGTRSVFSIQLHSANIQCHWSLAAKPAHAKAAQANSAHLQLLLAQPSEHQRTERACMPAPLDEVVRCCTSNRRDGRVPTRPTPRGGSCRIARLYGCAMLSSTCCSLHTAHGALQMRRRRTVAALFVERRRGRSGRGGSCCCATVESTRFAIRRRRQVGRDGYTPTSLIHDASAQRINKFSRRVPLG